MSKAGTLRGLGATHAVVDLQSLMQCLTYDAVSYIADNYTFSNYQLRIFQSFNMKCLTSSGVMDWSGQE